LAIIFVVKLFSMKLGVLSLLGAAAATCANWDEFKLRHVDFQLTVLGDLQLMVGTAKLEMERKEENSMKLTLDSLVDVKTVTDEYKNPLKFKNNITSLSIELDVAKPKTPVEIIM
jgi:hypothetical protein